MTSPKRRLQNAKAQATLRHREQAAGIVRVLVKIPEERRAELQQIARRWRDEGDEPETTENNRGS